MRQKLLLVMLGVAVALLLIEGPFRLVRNQLPEQMQSYLGKQAGQMVLFARQKSSMFQGDSYLGLKFRPNLDIILEGHPDYSYRVKTISLGFDDIGFRDDGIDDPVYAVAVGDSFTFGDGVDVEDTWTELLEEETGLDFVNLGAPRFGPTQYTRMLAEYGASMESSLVLWGFFSNDFEDEFLFEKWLDSGSRDYFEWRQDQWEPTLVRSVRTFLADHSITYQLLETAIRQGGFTRVGRTFRYSDGSLDFIFYPWFVDFSSPEIQHGWELSQQAIMQAKHYSDQMDSTLVVLLLPHKEAVYSDIVSQLVGQRFGQDIDTAFRVVKQFCDEYNIRCLDLTPVLREHAANGEQLYFRWDAHMNEEGQRLVAQSILDYLRREGLVVTSR